MTCIQLRNKKKNTSWEKFFVGQMVMKLLADTDVLFVVNDRADIAKTLGAEAVHVGAKDIPLSVAKKTFPEMIYGYSCNNEEDIETAKLADYIGVGPAFPTSTKEDLRGLLNPDGIKKLVKLTDKPAVAIGGINAENALQLKGTEVAGIAVSSAICASADPYQAAKKKLREIVDTF